MHAPADAPASTLARYDAACRAVAECRSIDEAKDLRDQAEAIRVYAHQAKSRDMEIDAAEIRIRAERRLGELIAAQKTSVGLARGGQPYQRSTGADGEPVDRLPTLADAGIDKKLSARAQRLAARSDAEFEAIVGRWRESVGDEHERITLDLLKAVEQQDRAPVRLVAENALAPIIYDLMTDHQLDAADLPLVFKALLERFSPKA
jgi:hypothetical protein